MPYFDRSILSEDDLDLMDDILLFPSDPDLVIAPNGTPYLYRWHLIPRSKIANVYFHIQTASDPERPLHDHPWENTSVILSGGYDEVWDPQPWFANPDNIGHRATLRPLRKGDVVHRKAGEAHRLLLPAGIPYTMTLFTTGPVVRDWGFWYPGGWKTHNEVLEFDAAGQSVTKPELRNV